MRIPESSRASSAVTREIVMTGYQYSGMIPSPEMMEGYERVHPGAFNRILSMAEKRSDHHIEMEKTVEDHTYKIARIGQNAGIGFTVFFFLLAAGIFLRGDQTTAIYTAAGSVIPHIFSNIYVKYLESKRAKSEEKSEKQKK